MSCCNVNFQQQEEKQFGHTVHSLNSCMAHGLKQTFVDEPALSLHFARNAYAIVTSFWLFSATLALQLVSKVPAAEAIKSQELYFQFPSVSTLIFSCLSVLLLVLGWNAMRLEDNQPKILLKPIEDKELAKESKQFLAKALSRCIQFRTISFDPDSEIKPDHSQLQGILKYLREIFPLCFEKLNPTYVGNNGEKYSVIFEWTGTDKSLKPVMMCSHTDVVPCPEEKNWTHPPFNGTISKDGVVWGRGAIDDKHNVVTQLFAVESFLKRGVRPRRTLYICMGHDEEIGGPNGAAAIATELRRRNVKAEFILVRISLLLLGREKNNTIEHTHTQDEGSMILRNAIPGCKKPIAFISNAEKGAMNIHLQVDCKDSGHSSQPPLGESNIGILAKAISRLEARPFPLHMDTYLNTLRFVASELSFPLRVVASNSWLFKPLLARLVLRKKSTAALVRTTTAVTILKAGEKINSIPGVANAFVNHRIHPGDRSKENVLRYDRSVINDSRVKLTPFSFDGKRGSWTPIAPLSSTKTFGFREIQKSVCAIFGAATTEMLMIGNTDTKHYWDVSQNIYRFSAINIDVKDVAMFHGVNERLSIENLFNLSRFYGDLIERVCFSSS